MVNGGPRELSICDARAIPSILGFKAKCEKGPFYDSMEQSVSSTRDEVWHKERRKVWDSAMKMCEFLPRSLPASALGLFRFLVVWEEIALKRLI